MGLAMSSGQQAFHRSWNSATSTLVTFTNAHHTAVRTVWLNHDGERRPYKELQPGEAYRQPTFTAHPWVFETVAAEGEAEGASPPPGGTVLVAGDHQVFYAPPLQNGGAVPVVAIRDSTLVPWSPAQHARFPSHFQAATRALLLAHHRSACEAASPSSSSDSSNGGSSCSSSLQQESAFGPSGISWAKRLLRRLSCCGKAVRQQATPLTADPLCEVFGKLPHEVVLLILAAAALPVPYIVLPAFPHGVEEGAVSHDLRAALFAD